eukprot:323602_1
MPNTKTDVPYHESHSNLHGSLVKRLTEHTDNNANIQQFSNQFETLQRKRRISLEATTPFSSPAVDDHSRCYVPRNVACNKGRKRLSRLPSPLYLNHNTPPVTPECRGKVSSLLLSPNARVMVITESAHSHAAQTMELESKSDFNEHQLETPARQRLRSLSCSEAMFINKKTKIMSPRLSGVAPPCCPVLRPIPNAIRKRSFDDPEPLIIPPSPRSPQLITR